MRRTQRRAIVAGSRRQRRRIKRKIRAWGIRIAALCVILMVMVLTVRAIQALSGWFGKSQETIFQGARVIENEVEEEPEVPETGGPLIVLDPGHGGTDQGTSSGDVLEKDVNLAVVKKVAEALQGKGVSIIMTREDDSKHLLGERATFANDRDAALFVSIHCNFFDKDSGVYGLECYYQESNDSSKLLAENIIREIETQENIKSRGTKTARYRVLVETDMPAALIELGYLSNPEECRQLASEEYQQILAEKIAQGILASVETERGEDEGGDEGEM